MIIQCIKEGFSLTHRNWQLILVRIIVAVMNITFLLICLGAPLFVAMLYLGLDIAYAKEMLPSLFNDPFQIFSKYIALFFVIIAALIFYMVFSSLLFLYALGGTLGVLKVSALNSSEGFSLPSFFREANRHFFRLFWLLSLLSLGIIILVVLFAVFAVVGTFAVHSLTLSQNTLWVFYSTFITLLGITFGILFFLAALVVIVYSMIAAIVDEKGSVDSIKSTFDFLKRRPGAFPLYIVLIAGVISANIILIPFSLIPAAALFINALLQSYLVIVLWSALTVSYVKDQAVENGSVQGESVVDCQ